MIELEDNSFKRILSRGRNKAADPKTHSRGRKATSHKNADPFRLFLGVSSYIVFLLLVLTLLEMNRLDIPIEIANSTIFILSVSIFLGMILLLLLALILLFVGYVTPVIAEERGQNIDWARVEKLRKYGLRIFYGVVFVSMICVSLPPMIFVISPADAPLPFLLGLVLPGIVLAIGLGEFDVRTPMVVALILLGATAVTLVPDMSEIADLIAICAYYYLVVGVVLIFIAYVREGGEEDKTTQDSLPILD
ncbi:MAG: hypothetical protein ACE5R6_21845 [Candidatus Heimdallarchaeota archaeon]